ncbi:hypothetical protein ACTA71_002895 [Dictyostelium dimigraforme]
MNDSEGTRQNGPVTAGEGVPLFCSRNEGHIHVPSKFASNVEMTKSQLEYKEWLYFDNHIKSLKFDVEPFKYKTRDLEFDHFKKVKNTFNNLNKDNVDTID